MKLLYSILITIILPITFSVNSVFAQSNTYTSEVRDGVTYISNKKALWASNDKIQLQQVRTIGTVDGTDENLQFYLPENILKDKHGNYFILDAGNYKIKKFDSDWKFLSAFGRQGEGPGEFNWPTSMQYDSLNDKLYVYDRADNSLSSFTTNGKMIKKYRPERLNGYFYLLDDKRYISAARTKLSTRNGAEVNAVFAVSGFDETDKYLLAVPEFVHNNFTTHQINIAKVTIDNSKNIYLTYKYFNKIQKYDSNGKLLFEIDRPLNYKPSFGKSTDNKVDISSVGFGGRIMKKIPISNGLAVDSKGRIWVITYNRQLRIEEEVKLTTTQSLDGNNNVVKNVKGNTSIYQTDALMLELYNGKGILLTQFPLDRFADRIEIIDNYIFILDQIRGAQYSVYEIIEKQQ